MSVPCPEGALARMSRCVWKWWEPHGDSATSSVGGNDPIKSFEAVSEPQAAPMQKTMNNELVEGLSSDVPRHVGAQRSPSG